MRIRYFLVTAVLATAILCFGASANAQVDTQALIAQLQAQIAQLLAQVAQLQGQQNQDQGQAWCHTFNKNLYYGDKGAEVSALHTALTLEVGSADGSTDYPNYSNLGDTYNENTSSGIVEFQEKYASDILAPLGFKHGTGNFGQTTRKKMNELYGCGTTTTPQCTTDSDCPQSSCLLNSNNTLNCPDPKKCIEGKCVTQPKPTNCTGEMSFSDWSACMNAGSISSPVSGDVWKVGGTYNVKWNSSVFGDKVSIALVNKDNNRICDFDGIANTGTYAFTVPVQTGFGECEDGSNQPGNRYQITVWTKAATLNSQIFSLVAQSNLPSITVTSPNGGETWQVGSAQKITWTTNNILSNQVLIQFSKGQNIVYDFYATNDGAEQIITPANIGTGGDFKITVLYKQPDSTVYSDSSDNYFSITSQTPPCLNGAGPLLPGQTYCNQPSITVISPNGGETCQVGQACRIKWNSQGVDSVSITVTNHGYTGTGSGGSFTITPNGMPVSASTGYYDWNPGSSQIGSMYKINIAQAFYTTSGITTTFDYGVKDSSDNYFSIVAPTIACTDSDKGLDYYTKGTITYNNGITKNTDYCINNNNIYEYYCTSDSAATYNIYACSNGCSNGACTQSTTTPSITVTSPNGGETCIQGQVCKITWTSSSGLNKAAIQLVNYSTGNPYGIVSNIGVPAGSNYYYWTVPTGDTSVGSGSKYKIKIEDYATSGVYQSDESDNYFSIAPTTTNPICTDSDNGKDYFVKGNTVVKKDGVIISGKNATDYCTSATYLMEYSCTTGGTDAVGTGYTCPNGCSNGACTQTTTTESVSLASVKIDGSNLKVKYSKSFDACAHLLLDGSNRMLHTQNLFCQKGNDIEISAPLSDLPAATVNQRVKLCNGNNYNMCSGVVTITSSMAPVVSNGGNNLSSISDALARIFQEIQAMLKK